MTEKKAWRKPTLRELPIAETQIFLGAVPDGSVSS
jgi:hypothetical protein